MKVQSSNGKSLEKSAKSETKVAQKTSVKSDKPLKEIDKKAVDLSLRTAEKPKKFADLKSSARSHRKRGVSSLKRPGVFFINGAGRPPLSGKTSIEKMAAHMPMSEVFDSNQKDKIMTEILRRTGDQPVMLVGYGSGADTAMEIANELNSLEYGFRKINLIVSVDAFGTDNDIVPQNVGKNHNFITERGLFADGPNVARNSEQTKVINHLVDADGEDILDDLDVQFKIFDSLNGHLSGRLIKDKWETKRIEKLLESQN